MTHLTVLERAWAQRAIMFFAAATALASMMFSSLPVAREANRSGSIAMGVKGHSRGGLGTPRHLALGRSCSIPKADGGCSQALAIDDLTAEEEAELLKYLAFLRSRSPS